MSAWHRLFGTQPTARFFGATVDGKCWHSSGHNVKRPIFPKLVSGTYPTKVDS